MSRIINRVRGIRGSFRPGQVITTPTRGTRGPAQLSDINTLASQLSSAGVGSGAAGNGLPAGGSDGQVLAKVAGAVVWSFTTAITVVGTISTGVWQGTKIALGFGGTGADLSATGPGFLKQATTGANVTVAALADSDLPTQGGLTPGSYTLTSLTVNAQGFITAASSGSAGGTGTVTHTAGALTAHAPIVGNGSADIKALAAMTDGQLLIGSTGNDPSLATLTAGNAINITNASGSVTIKVPDTAVTPGSYTLSSITVDQQGRITAASSGSAASAGADWDAYVQGGFGVGAFGSGGFGSLNLENANNGQIETGQAGQIWRHNGAGAVPNWENGGQILGTVTNDDASTGNIGEYIVSNQISVSIGNTTVANLTSISLSAGDWDVTGAIAYRGSGFVMSEAYCCVSTTSLDVSQNNMEAAPWCNFSTSSATYGELTIAPPPLRVKVPIGTTVTVYLVSFCTFSSGTVSGFGKISARRRR